MAHNDTNIYGMNVNGSDTTPDQFGHFIRDAFAGNVNGLAVSQNSTPNMTVVVAPGTAVLTKNTVSSVIAEVKANTSVTISTASTSNPRIDAIIIYEDTGVTVTPYTVDATGGRFKLASVVGTPASSPSAPTDSAIQTEIGAGKSWTRLANVTVPTNTTTIINSNISDQRALAYSSNSLPQSVAETRTSEALGNFVASGCVLSFTASTLNWSLTSGVVYINGRRLTVASASGVVSASKDTYFSLTDPGSGNVATLTYTGTNAVANNATSPTLPASSIWVGIAVSGASAITSVNTGLTNAVAPVISGRTLMVTDTNGQLIYPVQGQKLIGYAQITSNYPVTSASDTQVPGLSIPVIIPTGRRVKATVYSYEFTAPVNNTNTVKLWSGAVGSGTTLQQYIQRNNNTGTLASDAAEIVAFPPLSGTVTLNVSAAASGANSGFNAAATAPAYIALEIV